MNDEFKKNWSEKAFGWEVDVEFTSASGKPMATFHFRGLSKRSAYHKGLMKINADFITDIRPVTEEQWLRCYGIGKM